MSLWGGHYQALSPEKWIMSSMSWVSRPETLQNEICLLPGCEEMEIPAPQFPRTLLTPARELQNLLVWMERTPPAHGQMVVCHPTSLRRGILFNEIKFLVSDCAHKPNQAVGLEDLGFGSNQSSTGLEKRSQGSCKGGSTLYRNAGETPAALVERLGQLGGKGSPKGTVMPQTGQAER